MLRYLLRRFGEMVLTVFLIFTATFFLMAAIPGDALFAKIYKLPQSVQETIIKKYGYDKPVVERYVITLKNVVTKGEFGESITHPGDTVQKVLKEKLPATMRLSFQQIITGVTLGILLGIIAAMKRGTAVDFTILLIAMLLVSTPSLVVSLLLQKFLAGDGLLGLPIIGWPTGNARWFGGWEFTILPTIAGAVGYIASYSRLTKTTMLDSINQEFTMTARSKGLNEGKVILFHVVRNSFIPIVTALPSTIAGILSGSLFIERVFSIPGIGSYYINAVSARDIPMVMGLTVFYGIITVLAVFVTDILYGVVDPRIKVAG